MAVADQLMELWTMRWWIKSLPVQSLCFSDSHDEGLLKHGHSFLTSFENTYHMMLNHQHIQTTSASTCTSSMHDRHRYSPFPHSRLPQLQCYRTYPKPRPDLHSTPNTTVPLNPGSSQPVSRIRQQYRCEPTSPACTRAEEEPVHPSDVHRTTERHRGISVC